MTCSCLYLISDYSYYNKMKAQAFILASKRKPVRKLGHRAIRELPKITQLL